MTSLAEVSRVADREARDGNGTGIRLGHCSTCVREWFSGEKNEPANPPLTKRR